MAGPLRQVTVAGCPLGRGWHCPQLPCQAWECCQAHNTRAAAAPSWPGSGSVLPHGSPGFGSDGTEVFTWAFLTPCTLRPSGHLHGASPLKAAAPAMAPTPDRVLRLFPGPLPGPLMPLCHACPFCRPMARPALAWHWAPGTQQGLGYVGAPTPPSALRLQTPNPATTLSPPGAQRPRPRGTTLGRHHLGNRRQQGARGQAAWQGSGQPEGCPPVGSRRKRCEPCHLDTVQAALAGEHAVQVSSQEPLGHHPALAWATSNGHRRPRPRPCSRLRPPSTKGGTSGTSCSWTSPDPGPLLAQPALRRGHPHQPALCAPHPAVVPPLGSPTHALEAMPSARGADHGGPVSHTEGLGMWAAERGPSSRRQPPNSPGPSRRDPRLEPVSRSQQGPEASGGLCWVSRARASGGTLPPPGAPTATPV